MIGRRPVTTQRLRSPAGAATGLRAPAGWSALVGEGSTAMLRACTGFVLDCELEGILGIGLATGAAGGLGAGAGDGFTARPGKQPFLIKP